MLIADALEFLRIRLNAAMPRDAAGASAEDLFVLVVARFPEDYRLSLHHLSRVVGYFQSHRVFNRENSPDLHERIPQVMMELVTPSFAEQNEIWGALRVSYQPSALYRVRMVVFADEEARPVVATKELIQTVVPLSR